MSVEGKKFEDLKIAPNFITFTNCLSGLGATPVPCEHFRGPKAKKSFKAFILIVLN